MHAVAQKLDVSSLTGTNLYRFLADRAIELALAEDLASGDITSNAVLSEPKTVLASLLFKEPGIVAGLNVFKMVMQAVDSNVEIEELVQEGHEINKAPSVCAKVKGSACSILAAERTALNFMQRLSGIATLTSKYVSLARPSGIKILDTRKTTPGLRVFEKEAVLAGGGVNHRFGLGSAILIKDNHLQLGASITDAVGAVRRLYPNEQIEVETCTLEQVQEAALLSVTTIMLDNMTPNMVSNAVEINNGRSKIEVSGGINLDNIQNYLIPGVDAISIGALTHCIKSIDISLEIEA